MGVIPGLGAADAGTATIGGCPYRSLKNPLRHVGSLLDAGGGDVMTTSAVAPHRSLMTPERESFWYPVHAEWTKFRTVRGWVIAILVLGLLYLFPIAAAVISDATISRHLQQVGPLPAGLDVQAAIGLNGLPLTPWQGLGVAALWTAGALLLGALVLNFRDA
jgi:hypothetical protein